MILFRAVAMGERAHLGAGFGPEGRVTQFTYDLSQKRTSQTVGAGTSDAATTYYAYNNVGDLITTTDPRGKLWTKAYDLLHRRTSSTDPLSHATNWTYDAAGNMLTETRADSGVTTKTYDTMNRVLTTTDPKSQTTTFTYDGEGAVATLTDARTNAYAFTYDLRERKTRMTYPGGSHEDWTYDNVGNNDTYTTRAGQVKTITYSNRNWPTAESWAGTGVLPLAVTKAYDAVGRLLYAGNAQVYGSYTPDGENQVYYQVESNLLGTAFQQTQINRIYDGDHLMTELDVTAYLGSGTKYCEESYSYTARQQLDSVQLGITLIPTATYTYDLNGNCLTKTWRNGVVTTSVYDDANRLTSVAHTKGSANLLANGYAYNSVNDRTSRAETIAAGSPATDAYGYDAVDQVTSVAYASSRNVSYDYDAVGNRTTVGDTEGVTVQPNEYSTNALNQYMATDGNSPTYDANGNLTSLTTGTGTATYQYDAQNCLVHVSNSSGTAFDYQYDAFNRCVARGNAANGNTTFFYDGWNLAAEVTPYANTASFYVHGTRPDELIVRINDNGITAKHYYQQDGLGSVVALTTSAGILTERYTYDIYGTPTIYNNAGTILSGSAQLNRFLFTGREWLGDYFGASLYDYRNRLYAPSLGRFLQTDPIRFDAKDVDLYGYCLNNPIKATDPFGLELVFKYPTNSVCCQPKTSIRVKISLGAVLMANYKLWYLNRDEYDDCVNSALDAFDACECDKSRSTGTCKGELLGAVLKCAQKAIF